MSEEQHDNTRADPYANIFFSKDRTETIIEPVADKPDKEQPSILSRSEWMRGCPEGSRSSYTASSKRTNPIDEQSYLFQHYTYLEAGDLSCPGDCGRQYKREPTDFFQLPAGIFCIVFMQS